MRAFLFVLAIAVVGLVASPVFWSLVRMKFAAEPVGYVQQDGTVQTATIGPKSWWPDWAPRPSDTKVDVESYFAAATDMAARGVAAVAFSGGQRPVVERYEADLKANGFAVTRYARESWSPDLPPLAFTLCVIEGVKEAALPRTVRLIFSVESKAMPAKLHWTEGYQAPMLGMTPGDCF